MRIAVLGATGSTGKKVIERGLALGHEMVAIARRPEAITPATRLRVFRADALDGASLNVPVEGANAVISCIGPANNFSPGMVMSEGIPNIVAACQRVGIRRFVMQSGITLSEGTELSVANRWAIRVLRRIFSKACNDKAVAEQIVQGSDLDWVIVRPAALREAAPRLKYMAGPNARIAPLLPLSFGDCADCLIRAAIEPTWIRRIINVGR